MGLWTLKYSVLITYLCFICRQWNKTDWLLIFYIKDQYFLDLFMGSTHSLSMKWGDWWFFSQEIIIISKLVYGLRYTEQWRRILIESTNTLKKTLESNLYHYMPFTQMFLLGKKDCFLEIWRWMLGNWYSQNFSENP